MHHSASVSVPGILPSDLAELRAATFPTLTLSESDRYHRLSQCFTALNMPEYSASHLPSVSYPSLQLLLQHYTASIPFTNLPFCFENPGPINQLPIPNSDCDCGSSSLSLYHPAVFLDFHSIFSRLIIDRLGGCCYELHGMFNWILEQIGFHCSIVRVFINRNRREPDTLEIAWAKADTHVFTQVYLPESNCLYLIEIGVGSIDQPLKVFDFTLNQVYTAEQCGSDGVQYRFQHNPDAESIDLYFYDLSRPEPHWIARNRIFLRYCPIILTPTSNCSSNTPITNLSTPTFHKTRYPDDLFGSLTHTYMPDCAIQSMLMIFRVEQNGSAIRSMQNKIHSLTVRENGKINMERSTREILENNQQVAQVMEQFFGIRLSEEQVKRLRTAPSPRYNRGSWLGPSDAEFQSMRPNRQDIENAHQHYGKR